MVILTDNQGGSITAGVVTDKGGALWTRDFVLMCLCNVVMSICFYMLLPTFSVYVKFLGWNDSAAGIVVGILTFSSLFVRPWAGRVADTYGRRGIWIVANIVFLMVVLCYNWLIIMPLLFVLRIIHGFSWGAYTNATSAAAADLIPPQRLGEGMGFSGLGIGIGAAVAPGLGFYLIRGNNFSHLFYMVAALSFIALLFAVVIRLPKLRIQPGGPPPALWEPTAVRPAVVMFFAAFILGVVMTFLALFAAEKGIANAGAYFTIYAFTLVITRPLGGTLFDRLGHRVIVVTSFLCLCAAMLLISLTTGLVPFLVAALLQGVGFGSLQSTLQALSVAKCAPERRGAAQSTFFTSYDIGIGTGSMVMGFFVRPLGYGGIYLVSAAIALTGLLIYLAMSKNF